MGCKFRAPEFEGSHGVSTFYGEYACPAYEMPVIVETNIDYPLWGHLKL